MSQSFTKFTQLTASGEWRAFRHANVYAWERTTGPARLVIGPTGSPIELMRDLARCWRGPYWVLYVLGLSRAGAAPEGRYQSPGPLSRVEVEAFLLKHQAFLESDGRHALWVASTIGEGTLVYDRHEVIYAYGPLEQYEDVLRSRGIGRGSLATPVPHGHNYHTEHDASEAALLSEWEWIHSPLQDGDDD